MKTTINLIVLTWIIMLTLAPLARAADHSTHANHGSQHQMDHSAHQGMLIQESMVDGYHLAYHLLDMKARTAHMKNMPEMKATHHLMLYIKSPDGHQVGDGKVGFLITGPDGTKQKVMAMGMQGAFGADIDLAAKGAYKVSSKVVAQGKTIQDSFTHKEE